MSAVSNPWNNLTTLGKIVLPLLALIIVASLGFALLWITGVGAELTAWVIDTGEANIEILRFVAAATGVPSIGHLRDIMKLNVAAVTDLNCHSRLLAVSDATRVAPHRVLGTVVVGDRVVVRLLEADVAVVVRIRVDRLLTGPEK